MHRREVTDDFVVDAVVPLSHGLDLVMVLGVLLPSLKAQLMDLFLLQDIRAILGPRGDAEALHHLFP